MTKIKILSIFTILFAAFSFVSCDNEPIDPTLLQQVNSGGNNAGGGSGGSGGSGGGTSSGDYWPTALNNQWIYSLNGVPQQPMKMVSVNSIGGFTYYTFNQATGAGGGATGTGVSRLRKSSGDYFIKLEDMNISAGGFNGVQTGYEMLLLKDYLTAGSSWTGSYSQTTTYTDPSFPVITQNTNYTGTILSTGNTEVVDGETYTNVIKMKLSQTTSINGVTSSAADTEYWFAKNVGPIKNVITSGATSYTNILTDYTLF
ncbi:hypothetical protein [Flavobacterium sp.]|uniref:hypothetical protein n=1 Tax=Flavobacterium sp. TaxID=239 RepID=UPI0026160B84|nr:hypothetical protein [Flavobacterium sp.]